MDTLTRSLAHSLTLTLTLTRSRRLAHEAPTSASVPWDWRCVLFHERIPDPFVDPILDVFFVAQRPSSVLRQFEQGASSVPSGT